LIYWLLPVVWLVNLVIGHCYYSEGQWHRIISLIKITLVIVWCTVYMYQVYEIPLQIRSLRLNLVWIYKADISVKLQHLCYRTTFTIQSMFIVSNKIPYSIIEYWIKSWQYSTVLTSCCFDSFSVPCYNPQDNQC
jgi:hypothetical protein